MPYATRDGVRLYYEQAGYGDPPIVFVHGWCCDRTFFQPQYDYFQAVHSVATLDLRGCGKSDRPEDGYDIPSLADDVACVCRDAGIERPVIVGHSLGGLIAIEVAARYPSLPAAVVAVDPGPISITPESRSTFEAFVAQMEGPDGEAVRRAWVDSKGMYLETDDSDRRRGIVEAMCAVPMGVAIQSFRGANAWNGVGALLHCGAPLLVILAATGGSNDPARLLAIRPDVQIGVTVGAGHFNQLEVPEQVNAMIERFLQTAVRSTTG
jgi:pimeloyl-ACP methyl ester carboxylesterase